MVENENTFMPEIPIEEPVQNKKKSGKKVYIIILVLILIVCCIRAVYQFTNSVSATVMINSFLAANGQNPDGTPFSIMEIFNDDVMNNAVEKLGGKMSAEELRDHLNISDTMTDDSFIKLEQSIFNSEDKNTYFPTEYLLTYSTISEQIKNEGFLAECKSLLRSFSLPSKKEILTAVLQSYQEHYAEVYLSYEPLFEIDWDAVDSMDYYNRFEFMDDTIQRLMDFLQYKNARTTAKDGTYNDSGYYDLIIELSKGPAHGINDYKSYVTQNGVTNNKTDLLRQFAYMHDLCEEENIRKTKEYEILREAIEMYDSTTTRVVFIPALDESKEFYMNRTNVGLDYLTEKADAAKIQADTAEYSAKHYLYLQTCFGDEYTIDENGNKKQIKNTSSQKDHADGLYEDLKKEIKQLTSNAEFLTINGHQTEWEEIKISDPFSNVSIVGIALSLAKRFVLLVMSAYVIVYVIVAIAKKKRA